MARVIADPLVDHRMYDTHPALDAPMRLRIDYARVVAAVAAGDRQAGAPELESLRGLCGALGLPPGATEGVVRFAQSPAPDRVRESVEALRDTGLGPTLVTDLVALAMSDGKYHISERKQIHGLAALLLVPERAIAAIEDEVARSLVEGHVVDEPLTTRPSTVERTVVRVGGEVAGSVAAAAVPLAVLWAFSPRGLSMTGVTKALDVLGLGFGPLAGVVVDVGTGLAAYVAVRVAYRAFVR